MMRIGQMLITIVNDRLGDCNDSAIVQKIFAMDDQDFEDLLEEAYKRVRGG